MTQAEIPAVVFVRTRARWSVVAGVLLVGAAFLFSVAMPLATYAGTLALFGFAHVVSEMRFVDQRYGARLRGRLGLWLLPPLVVALAARALGTFGSLPGAVTVGVELAAGAVMLAMVVAIAPQRRVMVGALGAALLAGAVLAPIHTLLALAVAHNFTPLAFLADTVAPRRRRAVMTGATLLFLGGPLLIASGVPYALLANLGLAAPEFSPFAGMSLFANLPVYVPRELTDETWAVHAFSAAVFAQCLHYMAVILVLPRMAPQDGPTLVKWPRAGVFFAALAAAGAALSIGYFLDFTGARRLYAFAALLHSWIEIPILALALALVGAGVARAQIRA